jgi:hypothetical protein
MFSGILPRSPQLTKWQAALQFYLQSGKQKSRVGGDDSHVAFCQKFPGEKGTVRQCCNDATASYFVAKVRGEAVAHFHAVAMKRHSSLRNWLFCLSERILYEHSP